MRSPVRLYLLVSRPYLSSRALEILNAVGPWVDLMVDCGAHTDYMKGQQPLNVEAYASWVREAQKLLREVSRVRFFSYDLVANPKVTRRNYDYMVDQGLKVIPIITWGCGQEDARHYLDGAETVGIGGITNNKGRGQVRKFLSFFPMERQHWFGFSPTRFIRVLRPQSFDCSSFMIAHRYGLLPFPSLQKTLLPHLRWGTPITRAHRAAIRRVGYNPADLLKRASWKLKTGKGPAYRHIAQCILLDNYRAYQQHDLDKVGVRMYYAVTPAVLMRTVVHGLRSLEDPCVCGGSTQDHLDWIHAWSAKQRRKERLPNEQKIYRRADGP